MIDVLYVKFCLFECEDLCFVYQFDNNVSVMCYWFEELYEVFVEFFDLYDKYIYD